MTADAVPYRALLYEEKDFFFVYTVLFKKKL